MSPARERGAKKKKSCEEKIMKSQIRKTKVKKIHCHEERALRKKVAKRNNNEKLNSENES